MAQVPGDRAGRPPLRVPFLSWTGLSASCSVPVPTDTVLVFENAGLVMELFPDEVISPGAELPTELDEAGRWLRRRTSPASRFVSAFRARTLREVVCGHGPQQLNLYPPLPLPGQVVDHPRHMALLAGV